MALSQSAESGPVLLPALARFEWRMGLRSGAFRLGALLSLLAGLGTGGAPGRGTALSAYSTGEAACFYMGLVAILWSALAAVRETTLRTEPLVASKPQPNEILGMLRFFGAFLPVLGLLAALFLGAVMGRLLSGGSLMGGEVYLLQLARAAGVLFVVSAASFTLAILSASPLAGALVGLYWALASSARPYLAKLYFPQYSQNLPAFLALGVGLLGLALWLHRRERRGDSPPSRAAQAAAIGGIALAGWLAWGVVRQGHDPQALLHPHMERMGEQDSEMGQVAAGFTLPDQNGRLIGLSHFPGKILVIALFTPREAESVQLLDLLNDIAAEYGRAGVQPVAICLSQDQGAAATFARGERLRYPVVSDWGTYNAPIRTEISPLASAYRADLLPKLIVTDRRRVIRHSTVSAAEYDRAVVTEFIRKRLEAEPR